jgi:hypothetical protein
MELLQAIGVFLGACSAVAVFIIYTRRQHTLDIEGRKQQVAFNKVRENLALNVGIKTRVVKFGDKLILEVTVEVQNISSVLYYVPAVYITAGQVDANASTDQRSFSNLRKCKELSFRNGADYGNTMCKLAPTEIELFTVWFILDSSAVKDYPTVVARTDVVGAASEKGLGVKDDRQKLIDFMNSPSDHDPDMCGHNHSMFGSWPQGRYAEEKKRPGMPENRVIFKAPKPDDTERYVDLEKTLRFSAILDSTMMWDRFKVVSLADEAEKG